MVSSSLALGAGQGGVLLHQSMAADSGMEFGLQLKSWREWLRAIPLLMIAYCCAPLGQILLRRESEKRVRYWVLTCLGKEAKQYSKLIAEDLRSGDNRGRLIPALALAVLGERADWAIPMVLTATKEEVIFPEEIRPIFGASLACYLRKNRPAILAYLPQLAASPFEAVRAVGAESIVDYMGEFRLVEALRALLADKSELVQGAVAKTLSRLGSIAKDCYPDLLAAWREAVMEELRGRVTKPGQGTIARVAPRVFRQRENITESLFASMRAMPLQALARLAEIVPIAIKWRGKQLSRIAGRGWSWELDQLAADLSRLIPVRFDFAATVIEQSLLVLRNGEDDAALCGIYILHLLLLPKVVVSMETAAERQVIAELIEEVNLLLVSFQGPDAPLTSIATQVLAKLGDIGEA